MDDNNQALVKKKADGLTKWDKPLNLKSLSMTEIKFIGQSMAESGMFPDLQKDAAKAMVKILAGQEIGVTPFQAMTGFNIIQGKLAMGSNLMASRVKAHPKYDYRTKLESDKCTVVIRQRNDEGKFEDIGEFTFSMEDATRQGLAGKDNWRKFPQNMLFARAISNAIRIFAPDVFNGTLVYEPDELGASVDDTGTVVDNTQVTETLAKIAAATDDDQLTDIVTNLPADLAKDKNIVQAASDKFKELNAVEVRDVE